MDGDEIINTSGHRRSILLVLIGGQLMMVALSLVWFAVSSSMPAFVNNSLAGAVIIGSVLGGFMVLAMLILRRMLPVQIAALERTARKLWSGTGVSLSWPVIIGLSALAGVSEEMFFRGALQDGISHATTPLFGLLVSSILFGLGHAISWYYFLITTLLGLFLGAVFWASGALLPVMLAHMLYDIWAFSRLKRLIGLAEPEEYRS